MKKERKTAIELDDKEIEALQNKKRQERINLCSKEIQEVLDKHECVLEAEIVLGLNKVAPMIKILSKK